MNLVTQYRKSARQIIDLNPEMIEWIVPEYKDDGFGGTIKIIDSADAQKTEQVRFAKNENLLTIKESSIGFKNTTDLYILTLWFSTLEQGITVTRKNTGEKYKINQIEDLQTSGGVWIRRAKVEKIG